MKHFVIPLMIVVTSSIAHAQNPYQDPCENLNINKYPVQKYNPYTRKHETVYPDRVLKYNPYTHEYSYERPDAQVQYNIYEHKWEFPK